MHCLPPNPFATRYVQPGGLPWWSDEPQTPATLADRFRGELRGRAAIVGPHGTGKSTLLEHLVPHLGTVVFRRRVASAAAEPTVDVSANVPGSAGGVVWLALRRGASPWRHVVASQSCWGPGRLLIIDGFEQLSAGGRWWCRWATRNRRTGLLVTSHQDVGLPRLITTASSPAIARRVVQAAYAKHGGRPPEILSDERHLTALLTQQGGNLREVLMSLYDWVAADLPTRANADTVSIAGTGQSADARFSKPA